MEELMKKLWSSINPVDDPDFKPFDVMSQELGLSTIMLSNLIDIAYERIEDPKATIEMSKIEPIIWMMGTLIQSQCNALRYVHDLLRELNTELESKSLSNVDNNTNNR